MEDYDCGAKFMINDYDHIRRTLVKKSTSSELGDRVDKFFFDSSKTFIPSRNKPRAMLTVLYTGRCFPLYVSQLSKYMTPVNVVRI